VSKLASWSRLSGEDKALEKLEKYELSEDCLEQLHEYALTLQEYNSHTNLVANADLAVLLKDHILDALQLQPVLRKIVQDKKFEESNRTALIDIGSGAGFPGMILAITVPFLKVTLLDSIGKKCRFLESAAHKLGLDDRVSVICDRAEVVAHDKRHRERYSFATARAVGALPMVAELCIPFLRYSGYLLAQRSKRQATEEEQIIDAYASRLGGELVSVTHFDPDILGRELSLIQIKKTKTTPPRFPRSAAAMKKDAG